MKIIIISIVLINLFTINSNTKQLDFKTLDSDNSRIIWEDNFSENEKIKIQKWLAITTAACQKVLGKYEFDFNYYIYKRENSMEPVPWAHTSRDEIQAVHFYIDPNFSLDKFLSDWTAVHEISHLSIPFLGQENSWFAEGYATYMQNLILLDMEIYDRTKYDNKYTYKLNNARKYFVKDKSYIKVLNELKQNHKYPEMYYGAACFFIELNKQYESQLNKKLHNIIAQYINCCRVGHSSLIEFLTQLDNISNSKIASNLYNKLQNEQLIF